MSITSVPRDVMPSLSAAASAGDDSRLSLPTATASTPDHSAKADPIDRASSSSSSSGTTPRTSYALKMPVRSRCGDTVTASY